jgi:hypothetical protein
VLRACARGFFEAAAGSGVAVTSMRPMCTWTSGGSAADRFPGSMCGRGGVKGAIEAGGAGASCDSRSNGRGARDSTSPLSGRAGIGALTDVRSMIRISGRASKRGADAIECW